MREFGEGEREKERQGGPEREGEKRRERQGDGGEC